MASGFYCVDYLWFWIFLTIILSLSILVLAASSLSIESHNTSSEEEKARNYSTYVLNIFVCLIASILILMTIIYAVTNAGSLTMTNADRIEKGPVNVYRAGWDALGRRIRGDT